MAFERREILLIVGVLFIMIGTIAVLPHFRYNTIFAAAIAVMIYFGMKSFVKWRKKQIKKVIGQGVCAVCGSEIIQNKCPNCDVTKVD